MATFTINPHPVQIGDDLMFYAVLEDGQAMYYDVNGMPDMPVDEWADVQPLTDDELAAAKGTADYNAAFEAWRRLVVDHEGPLQWEDVFPPRGR